MESPDSRYRVDHYQSDRAICNRFGIFPLVLASEISAISINWFMTNILITTILHIHKSLISYFLYFFSFSLGALDYLAWTSCTNAFTYYFNILTVFCVYSRIFYEFSHCICSSFFSFLFSSFIYLSFLTFFNNASILTD